MNSRTYGICVLALMAAAGCSRESWRFGTKGDISRQPQTIAAPIDLMLPEAIRVHPFTGRTFAEAGGVTGVDVRIEAIDAFGDATKAFGDFRFEMYNFVPNSLDPKGKRIAVWDESILKPTDNLLHWDKITRMYIFKLQWDRPVPVGKRVVLAATFDSPFTPRLSDERQFVSGQ